jgi:hypothetical protein
VLRIGHVLASPFFGIFCLHLQPSARIGSYSAEPIAPLSRSVSIVGAFAGFGPPALISRPARPRRALLEAARLRAGASSAARGAASIPTDFYMQSWRSLAFSLGARFSRAWLNAFTKVPTHSAGTKRRCPASRG